MILSSFFFFSSRRRHTRCSRDWSSDVCSSDLQGMAVVSLRYFNASGATAERGEDHDPETHLIPNLLAVALGTRPVFEVLGTDYPTPDGSAVRDFVHVADIADAHVAALDVWLDGPAPV